MKLVIMFTMLLLSNFSYSATTMEGQLGLTVLPVKTPSSSPVIIFMSGDGGWAPLDKGLSKKFIDKGMPVVGWSSLKYYWNGKTPEQSAADLVSIVRKYQKLWDRENWMLVGFSFGADVLPFLVNRLPPEISKDLIGAVMLSPSTTTDFEIHVSEFLNHNGSGKYKVTPEVQAIKKTPLLCIQGENDNSAVKLCDKLNQSNIINVSLPGDHHFADDYQSIYNTIEKNIDLY